MRNGYFFSETTRVKPAILKWTDTNMDSIVHVAARVGHEIAVKLVEFELTRFKRDTVLLKMNKQREKPEDVASSPELCQTLKDLRLRIGVYPMYSPPVCVIIYSTKERTRAAEEVEWCQRFCKHLGIIEPINPRADKEEDLTEEEIRIAILGAIDRGPSCLIVAILSHGDGGRFASGTELINIKQITQWMDHPAMGGKPKVKISFI